MPHKPLRPKASAQEIPTTLAGTALAAAVSVLMSPTEFDPYDSIIGVTLLLILLAYEWPRARGSFSQRAAFASVGGLCSMLVVAGIWASPIFRGWLVKGEITAASFGIGWLMLGVAICALDCSRWRRRAQAEGTAAAS